MGGTFNPIHHGHLIAAQEVLVRQKLDRVLFVPNRLPPHRTDTGHLADAEHRYAMLALALTSNLRFFPERLELDRPGPSYTVDTVCALADAHPDWELTLIAGADSLARYVWKNLDELLGRLAAFVAVTRPPTNLDSLRPHLASLGLKHADRVEPMVMPAIDISSTQVRDRIAAGLPICYLVPDLVAQYIEKYRLYRPLSCSRS